eukprot:gb/GECG01011286.1/.p1 GENE.gb/GECG01011286.1/~~gb/GECG01011286.1/.p1  ORF type:complete len:1921 (+),score=233.83 gb/GECG01011286.1/:1-5763(+)
MEGRNNRSAQHPPNGKSSHGTTMQHDTITKPTKQVDSMSSSGSECNRRSTDRSQISASRVTMNLSKEERDAIRPYVRQKLRKVAFHSWGNQKDVFAAATASWSSDAASEGSATPRGTQPPVSRAATKIFGLKELWKNMDGASQGHIEIADLLAAVEYFGDTLEDTEILFLLNEYRHSLHKTRINYMTLWKHLEVDVPNDYVDPDEVFDSLPEPFRSVREEIRGIINNASEEGIQKEVKPSLISFRKHHRKKLDALSSVTVGETIEVPSGITVFPQAETLHDTADGADEGNVSPQSDETPLYEGPNATSTDAAAGTSKSEKLLQTLRPLSHYMRRFFKHQAETSSQTINRLAASSSSHQGQFYITGCSDGLIHIMDPHSSDRGSSLLSFRAFTPGAPVVDPSQWSALHGALCWCENPETEEVGNTESPSEDDEDAQTVNWVFSGHGGLLENLARQEQVFHNAYADIDSLARSSKERLAAYLSGDQVETHGQSKKAERPRSGKSARSTTSSADNIGESNVRWKSHWQEMAEILRSRCPSFVFPPASASSFGQSALSVDEKSLEENRWQVLKSTIEECFEEPLKSRINSVIGVGLGSSDKRSQSPGRKKANPSEDKSSIDDGTASANNSTKDLLTRALQNENISRENSDISLLQSLNFVVSSALPLPLIGGGVSVLPPECPHPAEDHYTDTSLLQEAARIDSKSSNYATAIKEQAARSQITWAQTPSERGVIIATVTHLHAFVPVEDSTAEERKFQATPSASEIRWFHVDEKALQSRSALLRGYEEWGASHSSEDGTTKMGCNSAFGEGASTISRLRALIEVGAGVDGASDDFPKTTKDILEDGESSVRAIDPSKDDPDILARLAAIPAPGMPPNTILSPVRWLAFARIPAVVDRVEMSSDGRFTSVSTHPADSRSRSSVQHCSAAYIFHHHPSIFAPRPNDPSSTADHQPRYSKVTGEQADDDTSDEDEDSDEEKETLDESLTQEEKADHSVGGSRGKKKKRNVVAIPSPLRPVALPPLLVVPSPPVRELLDRKAPSVSFDLSKSPAIEFLREWAIMLSSESEEDFPSMKACVDALMCSSTPVIPIEYLSGTIPQIEFHVHPIVEKNFRGTKNHGHTPMTTEKRHRKMSMSSFGGGGNQSYRAPSVGESPSVADGRSSTNKLANLDFDLLKSRSPVLDGDPAAFSFFYFWPHSEDIPVLNSYGKFRQVMGKCFRVSIPQNVYLASQDQFIPDSTSPTLSNIAARDWGFLRLGRVDGMRSTGEIDHWSFYCPPSTSGSAHRTTLAPPSLGESIPFSLKYFKLAVPNGAISLRSPVTSFTAQSGALRHERAEGARYQVDNNWPLADSSLEHDKGVSLQLAVTSSSTVSEGLGAEHCFPKTSTSAMFHRLKRPNVGTLFCFGCRDGSITIAEIEEQCSVEFQWKSVASSNLPHAGSVLEVLFTSVGFPTTSGLSKTSRVEHLALSNGRWLSAATDTHLILLFDLLGNHYPAYHYHHEKLTSFESSFPLPGRAINQPSTFSDAKEALHRAAENDQEWGCLEGSCSEKCLLDTNIDTGYLIAARRDGIATVKRMYMMDTPPPGSPSLLSPLQVPLLIVDVVETISSETTGEREERSLYIYDVPAGQWLGTIDSALLRTSTFCSDSHVDEFFNIASLVADTLMIPVPFTRKVESSEFVGAGGSPVSLLETVVRRHESDFPVGLATVSFADLLINRFPSIQHAIAEIDNPLIDARAAAIQLFHLSTPFQRFYDPEMLQRSSEEHRQLLSMSVNYVEKRVGAGLLRRVGLLPSSQLARTKTGQSISQTLISQSGSSHKSRTSRRSGRQSSEERKHASPTDERCLRHTLESELANSFDEPIAKHKQGTTAAAKPTDTPAKVVLSSPQYISHAYNNARQGSRSHRAEWFSSRRTAMKNTLGSLKLGSGRPAR